MYIYYYNYIDNVHFTINDYVLSIKFYLQTLSDGYIALVLPKLQDDIKINADILSEEQYVNRKDPLEVVS